MSGRETRQFTDCLRRRGISDVPQLCRFPLRPVGCDAMNLDVNTLFLVTVYVEVILGLLLLFAWAQNTAVTAVFDPWKIEVFEKKSYQP